MKTCTKCNLSKPISEFYEQKDRISKSSYCKQCFNDYCVQRWIQNKKDAILYKCSKCIDCGLEYPN